MSSCKINLPAYLHSRTINYGEYSTAKSICFEDNLFIACRYEIHQIKISDNVRLKNIFRGHSSYVTKMIIGADKIGNKFLFSANYDKTIKQWDINTAECINTFRNHDSIVTSLVVKNGIMYSGDRDGLIKQWNIMSGEYIETIITCKDSIVDMIADDKFLYVAMEHRTIARYQIESHKKIDKFYGHFSLITSILLIDGDLFSASHDGMIIRYNMELGINESRKRKNIYNHIDCKSINDMIHIDDFIFTVNTDGSITQWTKDGNYIGTNKGHDCSIKCILPNIITIDVSGKIKYWNINIYANFASDRSTLTKFGDQNHWRRQIIFLTAILLPYTNKNVLSGILAAIAE